MPQRAWSLQAKPLDSAVPKPSPPIQRMRSDPATGVSGAIAAAICAWEAVDDGGEPLLRALADQLGMRAAVLWLAEGTSLAARALWVADGIDRSAFTALVETQEVVRGKGTVGKAWEAGETIERGYDATGASPYNLATVLAIPACAHTEVLGVVDLRQRVDRVSRRELPPSMIVAPHLLGNLFDRWRFQDTHAKLTAREIELLRLASEGMTTPRIAERVSLSPCTVNTHFEHIRLKLQVSDRTAAVAFALRRGMIG